MIKHYQITFGYDLEMWSASITTQTNIGYINSGPDQNAPNSN